MVQETTQEPPAAPPLGPVAQLLREALRGIDFETAQTPIDEAVTIRRDDFRQVMQTLRNDERLALDYLRCLSGVDWITDLVRRERALIGLYMVWAALLYAGIASWLSWLVGRPLVNLDGDRYTREAELRSSMVRINENVDAIALYHGEADAKRRLEMDLSAVLAAMRRIYTAQINL